MERLCEFRKEKRTSSSKINFSHSKKSVLCCKKQLQKLDLQNQFHRERTGVQKRVHESDRHFIPGKALKRLKY